MTSDLTGQGKVLRKTARPPKKTEIKAFTGLRGLAVLFVMLFHWSPQTFKGGYLGVVIFMVLSGYLVTSSLLAERSRTGRVDIGSFYQRRLRRLYPPLLVFILILNFYLFVSGSPLGDHFGGQAVSTLLGYNNWYQIGQKLSYFDQGGNFNALTHMWTLSIDLQIYLVWPLLFTLLAGRSGRLSQRGRGGLIRRRLFAVAGILTLLSYITMVILYLRNPTADRAYYGTDTRLFAFTGGALLAAVFSRSGLRKLGSRLPSATLNKLGLPLLLLMFAGFFFIPGQTGFAYVFGMFAFAVVTLLVVAVCAGKNGFVAAFFRLKPLHYLGRRSYSFYLWQYALMIVWRDIMKYSKLSYGLSVLLQIPVLLLLTELSYRLVERGGGRLWRRFFRPAPPVGHTLGHRKERKFFFLRRGLAVLPVVVLLVFFVVTLVRSPLTADRKALEEQLGGEKEKTVTAAIGIRGDYDTIVAEVNRSDGLSRLQQNDGSDTASLFEDVEQAYPELTLTNEELDRLSTRPLICIGDSITVATESYLKKLLPELQVTADVSLQFPDGLDRLQGEMQTTTAQPDILYFLGTNGLIEAENIDRLVSTYPDRKIFFMTIVRPEAEAENRVNSILREGAAKYDNVHILDWYQFAKTKGDLFFNDGVHPNQTGGVVFAHFVAKGIAAVN